MARHCQISGVVYQRLQRRLTPLSEQPNSHQILQRPPQRILKSDITSLHRRLPALPVIPITAADLGGFCIVCRKLCRGEVPHFEVVGRAGGAYLGRHPAGVEAQS